MKKNVNVNEVMQGLEFVVLEYKNLFKKIFSVMAEYLADFDNVG